MNYWRNILFLNDLALMDNSRKYPYLEIPQTAFGISEGEGGARLWNSEGMGYLWLKIRRYKGISQVGILK